MLQELIAHNPDLQRLQNEGYEMEIVDGFLVMHHVPYVNAERNVRYGKLAAPVTLSGEKLGRPSDHTISFSGTFPCNIGGSEIAALRLETLEHRIGGHTFNFRFSNKPPEGYPDFHAKFTRYVEIISAPALGLDPKATAITFKPITYTANPIFYYEDTNSSRAGITSISNKLSDQRIAIIGMGGSGSYILDFIAKTPVREIHLYDGDTFCQHNAFRAPGAASLEDLNLHPSKADYFANIYSSMRKGIIPHSEYLCEETLCQLAGMDVVFVAVDSSSARKMIADYLDEKSIAYIDSGIAASLCNGSMLGTVRVTSSTKDNAHRQFLPCSESPDDVYGSNIQIAELNALAAILSVIQWKKWIGFYQDLTHSYLAVYDTNDGELKHETDQS